MEKRLVCFTATCRTKTLKAGFSQGKLAFFVRGALDKRRFCDQFLGQASFFCGLRSDLPEAYLTERVQLAAFSGLIIFGGLRSSTELSSQW